MIIGGACIWRWSFASELVTASGANRAPETNSRALTLAQVYMPACDRDSSFSSRRRRVDLALRFMLDRLDQSLLLAFRTYTGLVASA